MEALALSASVFSVVSLFIQLAEKVQHLHDFWTSFQNAPSAIRNVASDLQMFCDVLDHGLRSHEDNDPVLLQILTRCDSKVEDLKRIVERLEPGFSSKRSVKRNWSSFKATLKKNNLAEFQRSLTDTKLDLLLIRQVIAEKSFTRGFVALNNSITDIASQSSRISTELVTFGLRTTDVDQHITDVQEELQQMVERIQERTNINTSNFLGAELEQVFRKAIRDTMQSHGEMDVVEETGLGARQRKRARSIRTRTRSPPTLTPDLGPDKNHGEGHVEHADNDENLRPHSGANQYGKPLPGKRKIAQCSFAEYKTIFGTISWQSRTIKSTHQDGFLGHVENDELETYIVIQPAPWLITRCLNVQISRRFGCWTWRARQFPLVAKDALIFKYARDGNLSGVRDLFQHKLASPFDVDPRGYTPLHWAALRCNPSMCKLLIQAGAVVDAPCNQSRSPLLNIAAPVNFVTNKSENEIVDTFRALVTYGQADTSWLILHVRWCLRGLKWNPVVKKALYWLLTQEESYSDRDHLIDNETPMMVLLLYAGWGDDTIPMLNLLIDKGVDVDAQKAGPDEDIRAGYTALHIIVRSTCASLYPYPPSDLYREAASHLLRRGANPHIPDRQGHTPTTMALAAGTLAFGFWKDVVRAHKDIHEFIRRELAHPSLLRDSGWDEIALLNIFDCDFALFHSDRPMYTINSRDLYGWNCATADRSREPWWFDPQELIRTKKTPLPPVPRGWQKIKLDDRGFEYVETSTGTTTNERPRAAFFANLQTRKAQRRYRNGMITIETEGCDTELDDWCSDDE